MTLHRVTTVSHRKPDEERTTWVFSPWTAATLEKSIRKRAPGLTKVEVEAAQPETVAQTPPLEIGDIVQVEEGRFSGCILDLLAITPNHNFVCKNQYGIYSPTFGCAVIITRAVALYRKQARS